MSNKNNTSISIVIPNYNGRDLLEKNIPSLLSALKSFDFEIIVVDDCSTDDSVKFLKNSYPNIIVIKSNKNQGFSTTCNKGIYASKNQFLCLSNTDVTFTENYFNKALPYFKEPNVFAVKGDIINYTDNKNNIVNKEATSLLYFKRGFLRFNQKIKPDPKTFTGEINGQFVFLGSCFVCSREKMLELNGYNEIFSPFYWEDADLAIRALRKNYKLIYAPECEIFHQTSSTISRNRSNIRRRVTSNRNKFIFTWLHLHKPRNIIQHILFTLLSLFSRWIIFDWKYYYSFIWAMSRFIKYKLIRKKHHGV